MTDRKAHMGDDLLIQTNNISLKQIAESGQCFRMNQISEKRYGLVAFGEYVELLQLDDCRAEVLGVPQEMLPVWEDYFDLGYDYGSVVKMLCEGEDVFLRKAAAFGSGLRILRQEPFETLISFIISQNKNIPAIKKIIEKICLTYGEKKRRRIKGGSDIAYYAFPAPEKLAEAGKDALRTLGLGYRDEYVHGAALAVAEGRLDLCKLKDKSGEEVILELMALRGVGRKVASCVALFAFHKLESVPVDVWINRVIEEIYGGSFTWETYKDQAGLIQQYMFYYIRNGM